METRKESGMPPSCRVKLKTIKKMRKWRIRVACILPPAQGRISFPAASLCSLSSNQPERVISWISKPTLRLDLRCVPSFFSDHDKFFLAEISFFCPSFSHLLNRPLQPPIPCVQLLSTADHLLTRHWHS